MTLRQKVMTLRPIFFLNHYYLLRPMFYVCFFANAALIVLLEMFPAFLGLYKCLKLIYFNAAAKLLLLFIVKPRYLEHVYMVLLLIEMMDLLK